MDGNIERKLIAWENSNITVCMTVLVLVSCCHARLYDELNSICQCACVIFYFI